MNLFNLDWIYQRLQQIYLSLGWIFLSFYETYMCLECTCFFLDWVYWVGMSLFEFGAHLPDFAIKLSHSEANLSEFVSKLSDSVTNLSQLVSEFIWVWLELFELIWVCVLITRTYEFIWVCNEFIWVLYQFYLILYSICPSFIKFI